MKIYFNESNENMTVYCGGNYVENINSIPSFCNGTVIDYDHKVSKLTFIIGARDGSAASIIVRRTRRMLTSIVTLPNLFRKLSNGIMGIFSDNPDNDLVIRQLIDEDFQRPLAANASESEVSNYM